MQTESQNRTTYLLMAVLFPPTLVIITYFILGKMYFSSLTNFGSASVVSFLILFGVWILQGKLGWKMLQIYPSHRDTMKRVLLFSSLNLLIVMVTVTLICLVFDLLNILDYQFTAKTWSRGLLAGAICTILNQAVYETEASYRRKKNSQLVAGELKKGQRQNPV